SDGQGAHTFNLKPGNYVFTEKAAPEGYEVATAINFTVNPDGTVTSDDVKVTGDNSNHIVMVDGYAPKEGNITPKEDNTSKGINLIPKTGDSNLIIYFIIMLFSIIGLISIKKSK
ncbi:TPA: LPXTG cell wall anchor domain-containing protein, partial [Clostridium perfringens]|nr:LPXTG cell wall anchor domain-containing protein [Clostridium perfringens]